MGDDFSNGGQRFYVGSISSALFQAFEINGAFFVECQVIIHCYFVLTFFHFSIVSCFILITRQCFQRSMVASGVLEPVMGAVLDQWHDSVNDFWKSSPHAIGEFVCFLLLCFL